MWAYDLGAGSAEGVSIVIDAIGGIIASGQFSGTGDFNPYSGVANLTSNGNQNIYVLKLYVSPLPIELLSFNATKNKTAVDITWQTATETNNDYFTIEKSKDGNEFTDAGKIDGAGNSNVVLDYSFTDKNPSPGISYYRLKQTDFNGEFSYSKIVAVHVNSNASNPFLIYQNQTTAQIIIALTNPQTQPHNLLIYDVAGRVVYEQQIISSTSIINTAFLPGVYIANVTDGQQKFTQKFIVN